MSIHEKCGVFGVMADKPIDAAKLRNELELNGAIFHTTSDTETIVTRERLRSPSIEDTLSRAMNTPDPQNEKHYGNGSGTETASV